MVTAATSLPRSGLAEHVPSRPGVGTWLLALGAGAWLAGMPRLLDVATPDGQSDLLIFPIVGLVGVAMLAAGCLVASRRRILPLLAAAALAASVGAFVLTTVVDPAETIGFTLLAIGTVLAAIQARDRVVTGSLLVAALGALGLLVTVPQPLLSDALHTPLFVELCGLAIGMGWIAAALLRRAPEPSTAVR